MLLQAVITQQPLNILSNAGEEEVKLLYKKAAQAPAQTDLVDPWTTGVTYRRVL